ncbi:hypothetical protein Tco_1569427 [Tanacetum coccineum]
MDTGSWQALIGLILSIEVDIKTLQFCISSGKGQTPSMLPDTMNMVNLRPNFAITKASVHEEDEVVFYQTPCRHVKNEGSVVILPDFVTTNGLFIFEHSKIVYGKKSYRLELHQEFYNNDPKSYDHLFTLKIYHSGNFTSPSSRIYHCAEIEWYDLVNSERSSINGSDAMLEDLEYVPIYKEIEVYVEKNTMEVVLGTGKGVVIKEVVEDDEIKEASKTRNSGKQLVDHSPWFYESLNEKRNKRLSEEFQFRKLLFDIDLKFGLDFSHETLEMKNEDPYHGEDEAKENAELFNELDHLLEHVSFLQEIIVIIDGDAPLLVVDAPVVPPVIVLEE